MKITKSKITKIVLTEVEALDPITIFLEDLEPRKGKITIECYGESWSAYWGGIGDRTIAEFFVSCDNHYLAKNLSSLRSEIEDKDNRPEWVQKQIIKIRKENFPEITKEEARELWESSKDLYVDSDLHYHNDLLTKVFGEEWFLQDLPQKSNSEYKYLCRIIDAVREGLQEQ